MMVLERYKITPAEFDVFIAFRLRQFLAEQFSDASCNFTSLYRLETYKG